MLHCYQVTGGTLHYLLAIHYQQHVPSNEWKLLWLICLWILYLCYRKLSFSKTSEQNTKDNISVYRPDNIDSHRIFFLQETAVWVLQCHVSNNDLRFCGVLLNGSKALKKMRKPLHLFLSFKTKSWEGQFWILKCYPFVSHCPSYLFFMKEKGTVVIFFPELHVIFVFGWELRPTWDSLLTLSMPTVSRNVK